ncbi:hypothetical protein KM043_011810 [Ampulex compressa]|nr:hypothetical protein KM043_011810 [Ampulex compressa]
MDYAAYRLHCDAQANENAKLNGETDFGPFSPRVWAIVPSKLASCVPGRGIGARSCSRKTINGAYGSDYSVAVQRRLDRAVRSDAFEDNTKGTHERDSCSREKP